MVKAEDVVLTDRVQRMIRQYAARPELFFSGEQVDIDRLKSLVARWIEIDPLRRGGKACIKGTRIAVCDIIADTHTLSNPPEFIRQQAYSPPLPEDEIDAAFAFLILNRDKVNEDYKKAFGYDLPEDLYQ